MPPSYAPEEAAARTAIFRLQVQKILKWDPNMGTAIGDARFKLL